MPKSTTATEILRTEFDFKEGFLVKQKKYDFKKREEGVPYETLSEHYRGNHQKKLISYEKCILQQSSHLHYSPVMKETDTHSTKLKIPYFEIEFPDDGLFSLSKHEKRLIISQIEIISLPPEGEQKAHQKVYGENDNYHRIHISFIQFEKPVSLKNHEYLTYQLCVSQENLEKFKEEFYEPFRMGLLKSYPSEKIPNEIEIEWIRHCESCSNKYISNKLLKRSPPCTKEGVLQSLRKSLHLQEREKREKQEKQEKDHPPRLYGCSSTVRGIETAFYSFQHLLGNEKVTVLPFIHENMGANDISIAKDSEKIEKIKNLLLKSKDAQEETDSKTITYSQTTNRPINQHDAVGYIEMLHKQIKNPRFDVDQFAHLIDDISRKMTVNNFVLFWKRALLPFYFQAENTPTLSRWSIVSHSKFIVRIFHIIRASENGLFPKNLSSYIARYKPRLYYYRDSMTERHENQSQQDEDEHPDLNVPHQKKHHSQEDYLQSEALHDGDQSNYFLYCCPLLIETSLVGKEEVGEIQERMLCV